MNSLASEILNVITNLLRDDQQTLVQLSFVSRTFHQVAIPYLYRAPSILSFHQLTLFIQRLTPRYSELIKIIDLQGIPDRWQQDIGSVLNTLLLRTIHLENLDVGFCNLDPRRVISSISNCSSLRYLSLKAVRNVTDEVVENFVRDHPSLIGLDISYSSITDDSIYTISQHCISLEELDISGCEQISEEGIRFLAQQCKQLRYINIKDCYNVVPADGEFDEFPITTDDIWETDEDDLS
ncbi:uncharacterized protein BX664DRAFT_313310 [Halteromyces radiatus]|uniref:uncharacterized protein n=1 Tax=Halteromyces radiatus TaxID=101107 RepID=UPI00221EE00D|nr:uncharacterized protein BX664DRAFT_313310 [Halteromyces radiatus]KAI8093236.1 hypothetical protein BX664DRAFT_313310 [Halteromyces radiatus]